MAKAQTSRVETIGAQLAGALASAIESDPGAWTKTWNATGAAVPHNPVSGAAYSGTNRLVLAGARGALGYDTGAWATYRQWQSADCQVRRGSHGVQIIRAFVVSCCDDKQCDEDCGRRSRSAMRSYTVFNAGQCDGEIPQHPRYGQHYTAPTWEHSEVTATFEAVGADWRTGGDQPYYDPLADEIVTPPPEAFVSVGGYAATVAHEHAHWTGHSTRLNRPPVEVAASVEARAHEELIAELAAVTICNSLGLEHEPARNHAAYLKHWAGHLKSESGASVLFAASSAATKAASFVVDAIERSQEASSAARAAAEPVGAAQAAPEPIGAEERLKVARWMLERAAAEPGADLERAAVTVAALLDLDVEDLHAERPVRRTQLEVSL